MNSVMNFLTDNYIYVALGSLLLIIILIGIIVSSNKKKHKEKNPDMVSMSDVQTGSINDVANNLNMQNNIGDQGGIKPLNVAEVYPSNTKPVEETVSKDLYAPMGTISPMASQPKPFSNMSAPMEPAPEDSYTATPTNKPIMEEPVKEPVFEPISNPIPAPTPEPVSVVEPIVPVAEPAPEVRPNNEPEIMDIIDVPTNASVFSPVTNNEAPRFEENNNQGIQ